MGWKCDIKIEADYQRSADTHLIFLKLPSFPNIDFYFKDESTHPSGSLKHRLARSLFLYAICNGWVHEGTTIVEASSGSTAVSEAYFAKLLGLPFVAVMPKSTSPDKIQAIEFYGGRCHYVDHPAEVYEVSRQIAHETKGHFMDQFTFAERATDWRGNNNIAESIFRQMKHETHPIPKWIVTGAGTGGTQLHWGVTFVMSSTTRRSALLTLRTPFFMNIGKVTMLIFAVNLAQELKELAVQE